MSIAAGLCRFDRSEMETLSTKSFESGSPFLVGLGVPIHWAPRSGDRRYNKVFVNNCVVGLSDKQAFAVTW